MDRNAITEVLEWAYDKAVFSGIPGTDSSVELAEEYLKQDGTLVERVNSLIRWEVAKSVTSGFMTGLGGAITLPITSPANLASVLSSNSGSSLPSRTWGDTTSERTRSRRSRSSVSAEAP